MRDAVGGFAPAAEEEVPGLPGHEPGMDLGAHQQHRARLTRLEQRVGKFEAVDESHPAEK